MTKKVLVSQLFKVKSGDFHAVKELEPGKIPLVSCGDTDNGVMGYFAVPVKKQYSNKITVAYNGSWPIMSKFHPYTFGAKDDVAVLLPIEPMSTLAQLHVAALLNRMTWRYSYGRKCFREKLEDVQLPVPTKTVGEKLSIDEEAVQAVLPGGINAIAKKINAHAASWVGELDQSA
jgi:type I restriction enzyme M protein